MDSNIYLIGYSPKKRCFRMAKRKTQVQTNDNYFNLVDDLSEILESARKASACSINSILTAANWLIGYRIVEYELKGLDRADYYGDKLIKKIAEVLSQKFGRGFGKRNLFFDEKFLYILLQYFPDTVREIC